MARVNARHSIVQSKTQGLDPLADRIMSGAPEDRETKTLYNKAKEIYHSPIKKSYVEACLLASGNLPEINELIEVPIPVLEMYRDMFFDVVGMDKLSRLEVVGDSSTPDEQGMKIWALSQGLEFIAWRLGKSVTISPVEGLQELFTLSVYKSKEALFSGNATESSKSAVNWTKLSMDLARILKAWVTDADAAKSDIELALREINPKFDGFDGLN